MKPLSDISLLHDAIKRVKQDAESFTTNYFASPEQTSKWIARERLHYAESEGSLFLFRRDRDFYHMYHFAKSLPTLRNAIAASNPICTVERTLAVDLIGKLDDVNELADVYETCGFRGYTSLIRMSKVASASSAESLDDRQTVFAEPDDVPAIVSMLESALDRFVEQIPERDEIVNAVEQKNILVFRQERDLGGLLIFETKGLTSLLRYWYVRAAHRDQGIGARLMKTYFRLCHTSTRLVLWVVANNRDAIEKYHHYGFQEESLQDRVMVKKGAEQK